MDEKRICVGCGKEIYKYIDICPYCKTDNTEAKKVEIEKEKDEKRATARDGEDLSLRVFNANSVEMDKYKNEVKDRIKGFYIATPICIVIAVIFAVIVGLMINGMIHPKTYSLVTESEKFSEIIPSILLIMLFGFIAGACIWAPINELYTIIKLKRLYNNGILIKNLPYEVLESRDSFDKHRNILIKAVYRDDCGKEFIFKGRIYDDKLDTHDICDVVYNPRNPKKYKVHGYTNIM